MEEKFIAEITSRYTFSGEKIVLGKGMLNKKVVEKTEISIPLKTMNRHGLIAGATGTGKTKTLQILCEQLSLKGVPTLVMDIKGDLSGLAAEGNAENQKIIDRHSVLKIPYNAQSFPVELMTISDEKGVRLRATVSEFGPILFSKILGLNDTQQSIISIIFKYCDDKALPLVDLKDLKKVLQYVSDGDGKEELSANYGAIAPSSLGAILRNIVALEQQGAEAFFGEKSFDVQDLIQTRDGNGVINIVRLVDLQDKPNLFSTFMLSLLAEIYNTYPEVGDVEKPKLCIFIDEAHLIFSEATKALLNQIETVIKLIRSKGVGVFFVTQIPGDIPDEVLSQLGLKIQHALRGFTAKDKKEISQAVENYPVTEYYEAENLIQELGIGETFLTALDEKGIPTPLVHLYMIAPKSRMDILSTNEIEDVVNNSALAETYNELIDKESAYEILSKRMESVFGSTETTATSEKDEPSIFTKMLQSSAGKQLQRSLVREGTNILFGMLGLRRRR